MRIIVIGGVAAGTSAAAKARRNAKDAEIIIYEKGSYISYVSCGMPYYIGDEVKNSELLAPRDSSHFKKAYNIDVHIEHEVVSIHPETKMLLVKDLRSGVTFEDRYDKLVLAMGATAFIPPISGTDRNNVFVLRNMSDMFRIKEYIDRNNPHSAAVVGSGFVGQEICESLKNLGMDVLMLEKMDQLTPGLDPEIAARLEEHLKYKGVSVMTGVTVDEIGDNQINLSDGRKLKAELIILAVGIRPNVALAKEAGVNIGVTGAIQVNSRMETNLEDIYACGDCTEQLHIATGKPVFRPLGTTANKTGRIAGENLSGGDLEFPGVLGTGIFRIFDMTVALTGLSERDALKEGYSVAVSRVSKPARAEYLEGKDVMIKGIADKETGRLLGAQIIGEEGVDKRIDVLATAITLGAKAEDLVHLDLAYSPPYSNVRDPVMYVGMVLESEIKKGHL